MPRVRSTFAMRIFYEGESYYAFKKPAILLTVNISDDFSSKQGNKVNEIEGVGMYER